MVSNSVHDQKNVGSNLSHVNGVKAVPSWYMDLNIRSIMSCDKKTTSSVPKKSHTWILLKIQFSGKIQICCCRTYQLP